MAEALTLDVISERKRSCVNIHIADAFSSWFPIFSSSILPRFP